MSELLFEGYMQGKTFRVYQRCLPVSGSARWVRVYLLDREGLELDIGVVTEESLCGWLLERRGRTSTGDKG